MNDEKIMNNYSVFRFMSEYEICIPLIQREYIQGCNDNKIFNTTNRMIDDILMALKNECSRVNLNIIYGYSNDKFYPIDGQQRLTLLYLIIYYCAIRGEKFEDFRLKIKNFSYETKDSSTKFFEVILKEEKDISKILNTEKDIIKAIRSRLWFQVDWNNDVTINSVLSILRKLHEKIKKEEAEEYYQKIRDNQCVVFDICIGEKEEAKLNSSTAYISLNARGKILENFENVKSLLEKIEITLGNKKEDELFSYQYDRKYIDVFYKSVDSSKKLDEKTKEINHKSIIFLLNSYNLINNVFSNNTNQNYVQDFEDYYEKIYHFNKEKDCIMNIYFKFIHKILSELYDKTELIDEYPIIESIWDEQQVVFFQGKNESSPTKKEMYDSKYTVIFLLYIFLNSNISKESLKKLKYVLKNIGYDFVNQSNFDFANYICGKLEKDDIYEYFVKVMNLEDITKEIKWTNLGKDLKCRLKEQIIKYKVIDYYNKTFDMQKCEFDFFENYEKKYKPFNNGQLYYLLYITDLWNGEITKEKIDLLKSYLSLECILFSSELVMKKCFAIFTYCDVENNELHSAQIINERCNYVYIRDEGERKIVLSNDNLHKLDSEIYITNDSTEYSVDLNKKELNKTKLFVVKKVYDFFLKYSSSQLIIEWLKNKFTGDYNQCWLKYAVDRDYTELFENQLTYNNGNVYISINNEKGEQDWVRFDTRVLLLDMKKENNASEKYSNSVWSYDTKYVDSYKKEIGLTYAECNSNMKFINHFHVPIFNFLYKVRNLRYQYKKNDSIIDSNKRCFFYCIDKINLIFPKDIVYTIIGQEINLYQFDENYKYTKFSYSLVDDFDQLKKEESRFINKVNDLPEDYQTFEKNCDFWSEKEYKYLGGIYKFRKKSSIQKNIDIKSFKEIEKKNLYDFRYF